LNTKMPNIEESPRLLIFANKFTPEGWWLRHYTFEYSIVSSIVKRFLRSNSYNQMQEMIFLGLA
jgi:hypothetical protein